MSEVEVYTTPTCHYCKKIKAWMDKQEIEYKEHDISKDREKAREIVKKTGQRGVPQTIVRNSGDEKVVVGFQPKKIKELIH